MADEVPLDVKTEHEEKVFADTECAQALLDLAMSSCPIPTANGNAHMKSPLKRSPYRKRGSSSPVKRQCLDWGLSPPQNFNPNCVLQLETEDSSKLWTEIIHFVKLDHCYSLPGQLKEIAEQSQDVKEEGNVMRTADSNHEYKSKKHPASLLRDKDSLVHLLSSENSNNQENQIHKSDIYQPEDNKYKNFNLLLKCLTNVEETTVNLSERKNGIHGENSVKRADRIEDGEIKLHHDNNANDVSCSSDDGLHIDLGDANQGNPSQFACQKCPKVFSKRRYLVKHCCRMHPPSEEVESFDNLIKCPNCLHSITKENFNKHSTVCSSYFKSSKRQIEADLANCQFCGIRMRRHILVKHLAQEHCVENLQAMKSLKDFPEEVEGGNSDSDSCTLSGSEHEDTPFVGCGICGVEVPRPEMCQHLVDSHIDSGPVSKQKSKFTCEVCWIELPKYELALHIVNEHSLKVKRSKKSPQVLKNDNVKEGPSKILRIQGHCKHSMLQRFLSDSNGTSSMIEDGSEQCPMCVGSLVTDAPKETKVQTNVGVFIKEKEHKKTAILSHQTEENKQKLHLVSIEASSSLQ